MVSAGVVRIAVECVFVIPTSLAATYAIWRLDVAAWKSLREQRNQPWARQARAWKPTGSQVRPTRQLQVVSAVAVGVVWLAVLTAVVFVLLR